MNLFYLSQYYDECAKMHCDAHCVKMCTEYGQLLSAVQRITYGIPTVVTKPSGKRQRLWPLPDEHITFDGDRVVYNPADGSAPIYGVSHINNPLTRWLLASRHHYRWLWNLCAALCKEYTARYGKVHKLERTGVLAKLRKVPKLPDVDAYAPPLLMPDEYKQSNAVKAYRALYNGPKSRFARWRYSPIPKWYKPKVP